MFELRASQHRLFRKHPRLNLSGELPGRSAPLMKLFLSLLLLPCALSAVHGQGLTGGTDNAVLRGETVDAGGRPVADVQVGSINAPDAAVHTDGRGRFSLPLNSATFRYTTLLATTKDHALMGVWHIGDDEQRTVRQHEEVRIVMKPGHEVKVRVVDGDGKPVTGAKVVAMESYDLVVSGETDGQGSVVLNIPEDSRVSYFAAVKDGAGLDYFENAASRKWRDVKPLPKEVKLTLDGVARLKVKAVDSAGRPVVGARFHPWFVKKLGRQWNINVDGVVKALSLVRITNAEGEAVFDCLPAEFEGQVPVLCFDPEWSMPARLEWKPPSKKDQAKGGPVLRAVLHRKAFARGVVLQGDGQPAAGILLQAEGHGGSDLYCRETARTRGDGSFEFHLDPGQSYLVAVTDEHWSAPSLKGMVMREGMQRNDLLFTLGKGTLIEGTVYHKATGKPLAKTTVTFVEMGADIDGKDLTGDPLSVSGTETLVRWVSTDDEGRYTIRVGKGRYSVSSASSQDEEKPLLVGDEPGHMRDFHVIPVE